MVVSRRVFAAKAKKVIAPPVLTALKHFIVEHIKF
jgi:hypothetical protein